MYAFAFAFVFAFVVMPTISTRWSQSFKTKSDSFVIFSLWTTLFRDIIVSVVVGKTHSEMNRKGKKLYV